jgi:hypothetical protein
MGHKSLAPPVLVDNWGGDEPHLDLDFLVSPMRLQTYVLPRVRPMNSGKALPLTSRARRNSAPLVLTALLLSACADSPPRIGRDLPSTYPGVSPAFDKRVKEEFPVGSDESLMLNELRKGGFRIHLEYPIPSRYAFRASFNQRQIVCNVTWEIQWSAESGKITAIEGFRGQQCL